MTLSTTKVNFGQSVTYTNLLQQQAIEPTQQVEKDSAKDVQVAGGKEQLALLDKCAANYVLPFINFKPTSIAVNVSAPRPTSNTGKDSSVGVGTAGTLAVNSSSDSSPSVGAECGGAVAFSGGSDSGSSASFSGGGSSGGDSGSSGGGGGSKS